MFVIFAILAAFGLGQPGHGIASDEPGVPVCPEPDPSRLVECDVLEVLDGDSLVLRMDGEVVRLELKAADAPEFVERDQTPRVYSVESKRFLTNFLRGEQVAVFEVNPGRTDPLGRRTGLVYRLPEMTLVDLEVVRQGYGRVSTRCPTGFRRAMRWHEDRARSIERGLWGAPGEPEESVSEPLVDPLLPVPVDPETTPEPAETETEGPGPRYFVTRSGSRYHREGCQHLTDTATERTLESVRETHDPCQTCKPEEG